MGRVTLGAAVAFACALGDARAQDVPPAPAPAGEPVEVPAPAEAPAPAPAPRRDDPNGFGALFGGLGPGGSGGSGGPGYVATWYPERPVAGRPSDLGLLRQNLPLGAPLWREDGRTLALTGGVRHTLFFTDAALPDSGRPFPDQLWNVSLGLAYAHTLANGWTVGGLTSVGSASDRPFNSLNELTGNLIGFVRIPARNDRDAWLLGLTYSPVGNLNFPVPVVAYGWNPSDRLRVNVGLPFSLLWRPTDELTLSLSYVPIVNVTARLTWRPVERLAVFGGFEWLNEAYLLADRANDRDRFRAFEKRLVAGARWDVWKHGAVEVNGGYAFDRYYGVGENSIGNLRDRVDVASGAFLGGALRVRF